jgi:DNA-binding response OmpR family regulator
VTDEVATRGSILLAEDEPAIRYTFKTILEEAGYRVRAVPDFAAARMAIGRGDYDAVVTDVSLEKEGLGLELAREAKKLRSAPAVVVYTDRPTVGRLRTALALKVDYFAFKLVDIEDSLAIKVFHQPARKNAGQSSAPRTA